MKLKSNLPVRKFFAFLGALYLFCLAAPLLFAAKHTTTIKAESVFRIYDTGTETIYTVRDLDFLCGALPCEMNVSAPDEALKAQIIAMHTIYDRKRRENAEKDYDFTCDSAEKSIYTTNTGLTIEEQNRVRALCLSVLNQEICFEDEPIEACYFAVSAGCTQPFENVWSEKSYPYLTKVACPSDLLSPEFQKTVSFSESEIRAAFPEITFDDDPETWFSDIRYFDTGYVEKLTVCGVETAGVQVREALGLRSASFTVVYTDGTFTFTTLGYGHGVGMSQASAVTLAEGGMTADEILARFYPGTVIKDIK